MLKTDYQLIIGDFCQKIAEKLIDPKIVLQASQANSYCKNTILPWEATSLESGYPTLILLFAEMDRALPSPLWKQALRTYVSLLIQELKTRGYKNLSLFYGLPGICFSLYMASSTDSAYATLHEKSHQLLLQQLKFHPMHNLDLIFGINGQLAYLFHFYHRSEERELIVQMLEKIIQITQDKFSSVEEELDTGMAHGMAGCLAVLAKALTLGIELREQIRVMRFIIDWLQERRIGDVWPKRVVFKPEGKIEIPPHYYFDAWSHGAPGILNALLLAAESLKDDSLANYCLEGAKSLVSRFHSYDPGHLLPLCYGYTGVMVLLHQMAVQLNDPLLLQYHAVEQITSKYDASFPFGIKCLPPTDDFSDHHPIDNIGFLFGTTGVVLGLLSSISNTQWQSLLLIR